VKVLAAIRETYDWLGLRWEVFVWSTYFAVAATMWSYWHGVPWFVRILVNTAVLMASHEIWSSIKNWWNNSDRRR
jgi:hypothetical protein